MKFSISTINQEIRTNLVRPIVGLLQKNLGEPLRHRLIDPDTISTVDELISYFQGKSIAIVGNAPLILNKQYGKDIDRHDIVIRFNRGILDLEPNTTGTKTNIYCTGALDAITSLKVIQIVARTRGKMDILVPFPFENIEHKQSGLNILMLEHFSPYKNHPKYYMRQDLFEELGKKVQGEPTSGFSIINWVLSYANRSNISLYGFTFSSENRLTGNTRNFKQHNFEAEKREIERLILIKHSDSIKIYQ